MLGGGAAGISAIAPRPGQRVLLLVGAAAVALLGLVLVKVALGLVVVTLAAAPLDVAALVAAVGAAWLLRRTSGR